MDTLMSRRDREQLSNSVQSALDVLEAEGWVVCDPRPGERLLYCAVAEQEDCSVRLLIGHRTNRYGDREGWHAIYGPDLCYADGDTAGEALAALASEMRAQPALVDDLVSAIGGRA